jgi:hypothetical protein
MGAVYMECSAKERVGIDDIFDSAIVLATGEEDDDGEHLGPDGGGGGGKAGLSKGRRKRVRKACKIL